MNSEKKFQKKASSYLISVDNILMFKQTWKCTHGIKEHEEETAANISIKSIDPNLSEAKWIK